MGKLVVFWSPLHGQSKVTASMAAVSLALNATTKQKVCVTHTQTNMADLEGMFNYRLSSGRQKELYSGTGLSALLMSFKKGNIGRDTFERSSIELEPTDGLYLIPGIERNVQASKETDDILYTLLTRNLVNNFNWVFVDLASGTYNQLSRRLIEKADVFVVTLSQNMSIWNNAIKQAREWRRDKGIFYLVGGYDLDSKYSTANIARIYHNTGVNKNTIGCVPFCTDFMDAISDGDISSFYYKNEKAKREDTNGMFIKCCQEAAFKIQRLAERSEQK